MRVERLGGAPEKVLPAQCVLLRVGEGVAAVDLCFPSRYTHSSLEVCDLGDLQGLTALVVGGIARMASGFSLERDDHT